MLSLSKISSIGSLLYQFLRVFSDCFSRRAGRQLLKIYVQGQLSNIQRKNCEAIALRSKLLLERYNGFWSRSSGMKKSFVIATSRLSLATTPTPIPSA